ncbi:PHP domain-containing protein [Gudongella sp. SC589]|uniref:PHP domain-containing protein n=1 Tax=Gudongella sp. SC589 TaxID=3385990 RepID=UPI0039048E7B
MRIDMHTHTTASDGLLTPAELVKKAFEKRLDGIAITDHDSVDALDEAIMKAKDYPEFLLIPGVELGCDHEDEEVHILGYFIDYKNIKLKKTLSALINSRWSRGISMLDKLNELGMALPKEEILRKSKETGFIGRATIARELINYGYVRDINEAFDKYLDLGKPAYVERYKLSVENTINLIHECGGISILAHPGILKKKDIMTYCVEKGIMGVECYHSKHSRNDEKLIRSFANRNGLIITGGSDFHGEKDILGDYSTDVSTIPKFRERL